MTVSPVHRADLSDPSQLQQAASLFDAYRQFYGQPSDFPAARDFLAARAQRAESTVYLARDTAGAAVGFMQLYPTFSSVSMAPLVVLNDLYVAPSARRGGIGQALLAAALAHARGVGAVRLTLSTAVTNTAAQALYEAQGWQREQAFFGYKRALS